MRKEVNSSLHFTGYASVFTPGLCHRFLHDHWPVGLPQQRHLSPWGLTCINCSGTHLLLFRLSSALGDSPLIGEHFRCTASSGTTRWAPCKSAMATATVAPDRLQSTPGARTATPAALRRVHHQTWLGAHGLNRLATSCDSTAWIVFRKPTRWSLAHAAKYQREATWDLERALPLMGTECAWRAHATQLHVPLLIWPSIEAYLFFILFWIRYFQRSAPVASHPLLHVHVLFDVSHVGGRDAEQLFVLFFGC